jgi:hypothetical protein
MVGYLAEFPEGQPLRKNNRYMKLFKRGDPSLENGEYKTCLSDVESSLPNLAQILEASYAPGSYAQYFEDFERSGRERGEWVLHGNNVVFSVILEKYEGYLFVSLKGSGPTFEAGKHYLRQCYLAQGGNPTAQEKP